MLLAGQVIGGDYLSARDVIILPGRHLLVGDDLSARDVFIPPGRQVIGGDFCCSFLLTVKRVAVEALARKTGRYASFLTRLHKESVTRYSRAVCLTTPFAARPRRCTRRD